jgi:hypothetical protein
VSLLAALLACGGGDANDGRDTTAAGTDSTSAAALPEPARVQRDSVSCYVGPGSALGRAPGTVSDGPAGLRGWIRFEAPLVLDSGPARLVDSDGRMREARWHRVRVDSVTIAALDDFLRVEMRLFVDDDSARGLARAMSDAAREPAPGGGTRDFARDWTVAARRAPCDSMPGSGAAR